MGGLQWWHILIVVIVFLLLFGGKRLPEAARGLGRSMRILKSEVGAMSEDSKKEDDPAYRADTFTQPTPPAPTQLPPASVQPIPQVQPVNQAPKITVNGRPVDRNK